MNARKWKEMQGTDRAYTPTGTHGACAEAIFLGVLILGCRTQCHAEEYAVLVDLRLSLLHGHGRENNGNVA
jgi:hypothetical protein